MQLPPLNARWLRYDDFGTYVAARLRAANLPEMAATVLASTDTLKTLARKAEDCSSGSTLARADRDGVDEMIDTLIQEMRLTLASRAVNANRTEPYLSIYGDTADYYLEASISQQDERLGEFCDRHKKQLPAGDPLLARLPEVDALRAKWNEALAKVKAAETEERLEWDGLDTHITTWRKLLDDTYSDLRKLFGRAKAERFFPR